MKKILLFTLFAISTAHSQSKKIEMPIIVDLRIKDSSPHFILNRRTVTIDALGDWLSTASKRYGPHDPIVVQYLSGHTAFYLDRFEFIDFEKPQSNIHLPV